MMEQIVDNLLGFPSVFRHLNQSDLKFSIIQFYIKQGLFAEMKASHLEFVLIGQDSRDGAENQAIGGSFDDVIGNHQADTAMIVQRGRFPRHC